MKGFEQVELIKPRKTLDIFGVEKGEIVSPQEGQVRGCLKNMEKFVAVTLRSMGRSHRAALAGLGVMTSSCTNPKAVEFVKHIL